MYGYYTNKELLEIGFGAIGKNVLVSRAVEFANVSRIFVGDYSRIDTFVILAPSGDSSFHIGSHVQICAYSILNGLASIIIEDFSTISPHCNILSSCDNYNGEFLTNATINKKFLGTFSSPVVIRKHSIIGVGSTVLPGVEIGKGTAIGGYSLIKNSTEPFSVVAGVPGKLIKFRSKKLLELEKDLLQNNSKEI